MAISDAGIVKVHTKQELDYRSNFDKPERPWQFFSSVVDRNFTERLRSEFSLLNSVAEVLGAATVAEAYDMQPLIRESETATGRRLKVVNSGTIDRYNILWGIKKLRYLGESYLKPVIPAELISRLPVKRREQSTTPKIIIAGMTKRLECIVDNNGSFLAAKSTSIVISPINLKYLLGLLNSRLVDFYYVSVFGGNKLGGGYLRIGPPQLRTVPIRTIDLSDAADKSRHDRMVEMVELMLKLHRDLAAAKTEHDKTVLKRQIDATDRQIDNLVYELYGLWRAEIYELPVIHG
jgi:hypothetical protein